MKVVRNILTDSERSGDSDTDSNRSGVIQQMRKQLSSLQEKRESIQDEIYKLKMDIYRE